MRIFTRTVIHRVRRKIFSMITRGRKAASAWAALPAEAPSLAEPAAASQTTSKETLARISPVKPRPAHLAKRSYVLLDNGAEVDMLFFRLRDGLLRSLGIDLGSGHMPVGNRIRAETGNLHGQRPYFFLDPWEETGWLVEKTPTGFLIAPADKIVERETFMRGSAWDVVNIFKPDNQDGLYRLSSQRCGDKLMSLALYQDYLVKELKLAEYTYHHRAR